MKKVAPELDSLMWTLAEDVNERAVDEFGTRHPELRAELLRRMDMVKGLRGEKKRTVQPKKAIPRFTPKEPTRAPLASKGPVLWASGLVLAALAAAAFAVTLMLTQPVHSIPSQYVPPSDRHVRPAPSDVATNPNQSAVVNPPVVPPQVVTPPTAQQHTADVDLKPFDMQIKQASLSAVLQIMSAKSGIKIEPAPGMPNPNLDVDYHNMNAMDILKDMGRRYAFTPEDQHDGSIWLIPAVEMTDLLPNGGGKSGSGAVPSSGGTIEHKIGG